MLAHDVRTNAARWPLAGQIPFLTGPRQPRSKPFATHVGLEGLYVRDLPRVNRRLPDGPGLYRDILVLGSLFRCT
jgi:hypothetical protein